MTFISTSNTGVDNSSFKPHYVSSDKVVEVLRAHCDKVIINACRSGRGTSYDANFAAALVRGGISVVVAMSFDIVTRSVEIFTANLYNAFLRRNLPLQTAVFLARQAMHKSPTRISKFGDPVDVYDSIVPVMYTNSLGEQYTLEGLGPIPALPDIVDFAPRFPLGRDGDILHLECILLISKRPVLLVGQAGVGKTCLLKHVKQWWMQIHLIEHAVHLSFAGDEGIDATSLYKRLTLHFLGPTSYTGPQKLLDFLRNNRCLIMFDSLDSAAVSMGTTASEQRTELRTFLKRLHGGQSLVIIASRDRETWLGEDTTTHHLTGLDVIPALQLVHVIMSNRQNIPGFDSEEDRQYFEQIIKLVDRNPLAIKTLISDFLCRKQLPKNYYFGMLAGAPIVVDQSEYARDEGHRSMAELSELIDHLQPTQIGEGFSPLALAPFWKTIPTHDLPTYVLLHAAILSRLLGASPKERISRSLDFMKQLGPNVQVTEPFRDIMNAMEEAAVSDDQSGTGDQTDWIMSFLMVPGFELPMDHLPTSLVEQGCSRIVQPLRDAGFLAPMDKSSVPADLKGKGYMAINPLLPIMLRAEPIYATNFSGLRSTYRKALMLFYIWRTKEWPGKHLYYHSSWIRPRNELDIEFANWISAVVTWLSQGHDDVVQLLGMTKVVLSVQRGILKDTSRHRITTVIREDALLILLKEIKKIEAKLQASDVWFGLRRWLGVPAQANCSTDNDAIFRGLLQVVAANIAHQLVLYHYHARTGRHQHYITIYQHMVHDIKRTPPPEGVPNAIHQRRVSALERSLKTVCSMTTGSITPDDIDHMWKDREEWHRDLKNSTNQPETYLDSPKGWHEMPISVNSGSAAIAHTLTESFKIRAKIDSGDLVAARTLIDKALLTERNKESDDDKNKEFLVDLLREVDEKERGFVRK
jgi:hypothetical protein